MILQNGFPTQLQQLIHQGSNYIITHPYHHLMPSIRFDIYRIFSHNIQPPKINPIGGWLAVLTGYRVLSIWQRAMPLWEESGEPDNIDGNFLPKHLLKTAEAVLKGEIDLKNAWEEANERWYEVGNVWTEILEYRPDFPVDSAHACNAALHALHETLGVQFLGKLKNWYLYDDDELSKHPFACDTASSAMIAYVGVGNSNSLTSQKRLEFWQWWLTEAIPQAWELAISSSSNQK